MVEVLGAHCFQIPRWSPKTKVCAVIDPGSGSSTVEIHLYGKLRRVADCPDVASDCVLHTSVQKGATITDVLAQVGISLDETSNLFLNGELSAPARRVHPGDRLGVFPDDMATLYKWYFVRKE